MIEINLLPVREEKRKADVRQFAALLGGDLRRARCPRRARPLKLIADVLEHEGLARRSSQSQIDAVQAAARAGGALPRHQAGDRVEARGDRPARALALGPAARADRALGPRARAALAARRSRRRTAQVIVKGMSLDNELVALFMTALGDSPYFKNVELQETEAKDVDGLRLNEFELSATIDDPRRPTPAPAAPAERARQARRARDDRDTRRAAMDLGIRQVRDAARQARQGPAHRTAWRCCRWSRCWWASSTPTSCTCRRRASSRACAARSSSSSAASTRCAPSRRTWASSRRRSRPSSASSRSRCGSCRTARSCRCCSPTSTRSARTRVSRSRPSGPSPEVKRDFYAEVPIEIEFMGRFHDIATFFDQVSRLPRIVNVNKLDHQDRRRERARDGAQGDRRGGDLPLPGGVRGSRGRRRRREAAARARRAARGRPGQGRSAGGQRS